MLEAEGDNPRKADPWDIIVIIILCIITWYFGCHWVE